jgi:hypothetical protein
MAHSLPVSSVSEPAPGAASQDHRLHPASTQAAAHPTPSQATAHPALA